LLQTCYGLVVYRRQVRNSNIDVTVTDLLATQHGSRRFIYYTTGNRQMITIFIIIAQLIYLTLIFSA